MKSLILVCCGVLGVIGANAQTNNTRSLTLQDVIQQAVEYNFDVQVSRFQPQIDQLSIGADYGAYDPAVFFKGFENFSATDNGFNTAAPANKGYTEHFEGGLSGALPSGLTYDISSSVDRLDGSGPVRFRSTNNVFTTNNLGVVSTNTTFRTNIVTLTSPTRYNTFSGITLTQPLLRGFWWYSDAQIQIALDRKNLKIDELAFRDRLIQRITDTEKAYYELIFAYENIKVQQAAVELAERQVSENKRRVEVGAMAPLDEKQAESQAASSRADLIAAYGALETQQNVLKSLITDRYKDWHDTQIAPAQKLIAVPERFDLQESWRKGLTMRPDLLQSKVNLERLGITVKQRRNQLLPNAELFGNYGRSGVSSDFGAAWTDVRDERLPSYQVGGQIRIPLSNRAARYGYKAIKAQVAQAETQYRSTEQTILIGIDNAIKTANTDYQRIQSSRAAREYAELALVAEQKKLDVGKSTSFEVLQLQKNLTSARSTEIRAIADYNKDLSEISRQEGGTLERFNLNVKIY